MIECCNHQCACYHFTGRAGRVRGEDEEAQLAQDRSRLLEVDAIRDTSASTASVQVAANLNLDYKAKVEVNLA